MLETLARISDVTASLVKGLGPVLAGYFILMGFANRRGKQSWFERATRRRMENGKPVIQTLSKKTGGQPPWKDPALLHGAFTAVVIIVILSGYILFMLLWDMISKGQFPDEKQIVTSISFLMTYPITMTGFVIFQQIKQVRKDYPLKSYSALIIYSAFCVVATWFVPWLIHPFSIALIAQLALLTVISFSVSFAMGMQEGIKEADLEQRFPPVTVYLKDNERLEKVRLYDRKDYEYRLLAGDGTQLIVPAANIRMIRTEPLKPDSEEKTA